MKRLLFLFLFLLFILFSLIIIFDLKYLAKGISSTYMIGKTSASIYDHKLFNTRDVTTSKISDINAFTSKNFPILLKLRVVIQQF